MTSKLNIMAREATWSAHHNIRPNGFKQRSPTVSQTVIAPHTVGYYKQDFPVKIEYMQKLREYLV